MKNSNLFTQTELKSLEERLKGSKKDPTGIFASRIKPKIKELFEWFKRRNELKKLIQPSVPRRNKRKGTGG